MPEQPPDPLHYEMKIPPEPDPNKQRGREKPPSDKSEDETQTVRDTNRVRGDDQSQAPRGSK
jgi:hypothetical protein